MGFAVTAQAQNNVDVYLDLSNATASPCDRDKNRVINIVDVQGGVNQALGLAACTGDVSNDSLCNIIDVQLVANEALGGQCVSL